jgi:hypothetical protein
MDLEERILGGFTFHSRKNATIRNEEDSRYDGAMKFQWLHANARHLRFRADKHHLATMSSEGRAGTLKLELVSNVRSSATGKIVHAQTLWEFDDEPCTRRLRVVIASEAFPDGSEAPPVQLRMIWKPTHADSKLSGSASLLEVDVE